jgi:serine/threonine protein kinase
MSTGQPPAGGRTANPRALGQEARDLGLIDPARLDEVAELEQHVSDPDALARQLAARGLLTSYQAEQLIQGRGRLLVLGDYVLLEPLGEGGMGQVFKARHRRLGHVVALKTIRADRLNHPQALRRFRREMEAAGQLEHPNIVRALDAGEDDGTLYFAMEYLAGIDLGRLVLHRGPLPVGPACEYIRQAALGLQHAHERGLVHRDIKPSNLFLAWADGGPGTIKLLDLGLARFTEPSPDESGSRLTRDGVVMGTPDYISPEQITRPRDADIRSDIYSLGCTFYHLLAGKPPFHGTDNWAQKLVWQQCEELPPIEEVRPDLPPEVGAVLRKMVAKRPEDRYQTPAEVAEDLAHLHSAPTLQPTRLFEEDLFANETGDLYPIRPAAPGATPGRKRGSWVARAFLAGCLALLGGLAIWWGAGPKESAPPPLSPPLVNSIGMALRPVPANSFVMGSPESEKGRDPDEPAHEVKITQSFHMGVYEVTQEEFEKVMGDNPSFFTPQQGTGALPVDSVTWDEAVAFCKKLSELPAEKQAKRAYRLPTEAEWEYACRSAGRATGPFCQGETLSSDQANFNGLHPYGQVARGPALDRPTPVGSYPPNALGLFDLHGNVWEWCADWYGRDYYEEGPSEDPAGPGEGERRVRRGGSAWFNLGGEDCRCANRDAFPPDVKSRANGFRVVMEKK